MASEVIGKMRDAAGRKVVVMWRKPFAEFPASAGFVVTDQYGSDVHVDLRTPEMRAEFGRLYREACRRADGEPPAGEASQHG